MEGFIGDWELKENENIEPFLVYCNYNWIERKALISMNINLTIEHIQSYPTSIRCIVDSMLLKITEFYIFDDVFHKYGQLYKKSIYNNGVIISNFKILLGGGQNIYWVEEVYTNNNKLILLRYWKNRDGCKISSKQIFNKK